MPVDADPEGVVRVRASNPSPLTLDGTNTYVVDGRWVVDPGPADASHLSAVRDSRMIERLIDRLVRVVMLGVFAHDRNADLMIGVP